MTYRQPVYINNVLKFDNPSLLQQVTYFRNGNLLRFFFFFNKSTVGTVETRRILGLMESRLMTKMYNNTVTLRMKRKTRIIERLQEQTL